MNQATDGMDQGRKALLMQALDTASVVWPWRFYDHFRIPAIGGLPQEIIFFDNGRNAPDAFNPGNPSRTEATTNVQTGVNFMPEREIFVCFTAHTTFAPRHTGPGPVVPDIDTLRNDIAFIEAAGPIVHFRVNNRDDVMVENLYNVPKGITPDWYPQGFPSISNQLIFQPVASLTLAQRSFIRITQRHSNAGVNLPNNEDVIQGWYLTGYRLVPAARYVGTPMDLIEALTDANAA